jgi:hypothetical protein
MHVLLEGSQWLLRQLASEGWVLDLLASCGEQDRESIAKKLEKNTAALIERYST